MDYEQKEITLRAKDDVSIYSFFYEEYKLLKGETITGLACDINGLKVIGIMVNNSMAYYYENIVLEKFDIIEEGYNEGN